jgi:hypothetical protein
MNMNTSEDYGWVPEIYPEPSPTEWEKLGMSWWNGMSEVERHEVLRQANDLIAGASVAQAFRLWNANLISMERRHE